MRHLLNNKSAFTVTALLFALACFSACGGNQPEVAAPMPTIPAATPEPSRTSLDTDIADMKTAGLEYVFVIRRRDGGVLDAEDRQYLRDNMPMEINRRVSADDGKALVLGSAFIVPKDIVLRWRARFSVEERGASKRAARQGK